MFRNDDKMGLLSTSGLYIRVKHILREHWATKKRDITLVDKEWNMLWQLNPTSYLAWSATINHSKRLVWVQFIGLSIYNISIDVRHMKLESLCDLISLLNNLWINKIKRVTAMYVLRKQFVWTVWEDLLCATWNFKEQVCIDLHLPQSLQR